MFRAGLGEVGEAADGTNHFLLVLPLAVTSSVGLIVMPYFMMRDWWCHRLFNKRVGHQAYRKYQRY